MKHKDKVKLARKMRTRHEIKNRTPIFQTKFWEARVERKKREALGGEVNQQEASRLRKERLKNVKKLQK